MSHKRTMSKVDEMGADFDKSVLEWKHGIERGCKVERTMQSIKESVEEMTEIVPAGLDTLDVTGLGLTCNIAEVEDSSMQPLEDYEMNDEPSEKQLLSSDPDLKECVRQNMGNEFDESMYNEAIKVINNDNACKNLDSSLIDQAMKQLQLSRDPGYQIIGDNVDLLIKVKHMSSSNQNKSIHWFNLNGVQHRITGNDEDNDKPIKSILDMENASFLPSATDNQKLLHDFIPLTARVIADKIPAFKDFQIAVVRHIPHRYSEVTKTKSTQVSI